MNGDEVTTPTSTEATTSIPTSDDAKPKAAEDDKPKPAEDTDGVGKEEEPKEEAKKKKEKLEESMEEVVGGHIYSVVNKCKFALLNYQVSCNLHIHKFF